MNEQLEKLILEQLREIASMCATNQVKLERLDILVETMKAQSEKDEGYIKQEIKIIEERIAKIEKFQTKLVIIASTVAFTITVLWEFAQNVIIPIIL